VCRQRRQDVVCICTPFERNVTVLLLSLVPIAATDQLIDLIVYRLYGLMEEEAVIEGTTPRERIH
jgi:hypothetical protein